MMKDQINRHQVYSILSKEIAQLNDQDLLTLIESNDLVHIGIGGRAVKLTINNFPIFVKLVPITDLELLKENINSTKNIFNLPLYYQYGVGSAGFGAWRELLIHQMTTDWVIKGECENFPIMYHYRILPITNSSNSLDTVNDINKSVKYWNNSLAVRGRLEQLSHSSYVIAVFLEYFPYNLQNWLSKQLIENSTQMAKVISYIEHQLKSTISHMNKNKLLHFDAHFRNILTDGNKIYFSDFGLALYRDFDLSKEEINFFDRHGEYDKASAIIALVHTIISTIYGKENWANVLNSHKNIVSNTKSASFISEIINKYYDITICMDNFYHKLQQESKLTPYPHEILTGLCNKIGW